MKVYILVDCEDYESCHNISAFFDKGLADLTCEALNKERRSPTRRFYIEDVEVSAGESLPGDVLRIDATPIHAGGTRPGGRGAGQGGADV